MDRFTEKLMGLLNSIDGACDGSYCGYDGLLISRHTLVKTNIDVESMCANFVTVIKTLKQTNSHPKDMIITFEKNVVLIKILENGFISIIMSIDGNLGRAKLECSKLAKDFEVY